MGYLIEIVVILVVAYFSPALGLVLAVLWLGLLVALRS
jgi:hypothetical protein